MTRVVLLLLLASTVHARKHQHHHRAPKPVVVAEAPPAPETPPPAEITPQPSEDPAPPSVAPVMEVTARKIVLPRPIALELSVGAGVMTRELSFNDDLFSRLHGYRIAATPTVDASFAWFPGAHFTRGAGAHLGFNVHGSWAAVSSSRATDGSTYSTKAYSVGVDALGRIPTRFVQPELAVGYGRQAFEIHGNKPSIPSVTYDFVRFALGLRIFLSRVEVAAHGAYRVVAAAGELESKSYFPRASINAVDFDASIAVHLGRGVALRGRFDLERTFASLNPQPGDPLIAGGAVDQSLGGTLFLAYAY